MISRNETDVVSRWSRIGVMFGVEPGTRDVDLERLVIDTTAFIPANPRLFVMATTWLGEYGALVARHRLCRMAVDQLDDDGRALLGLLLETVTQNRPTRHFVQVIAACRAAPAARPLFLTDQRSVALSQLAATRASALSLKWNLWADPIELKPDALRPMRWIIDSNPGFRLRAIFKGNLKASVMVCLHDDPSAGRSEAELSRRCGVTRRAISQALDDLELCGFVVRREEGRRTAVEIISDHFKVQQLI